jgi:hypothetical protein
MILTAMRGFALSVLVSVAALSGARAQGAVVSMFVSGDEQSGPFLSYFIEDCGECFVAQFSCGDGGGFALMLPEFDDETLSKWLADNGARGKLHLGSAELELTARQITFSEMSGSWDIEFVAWGSDASSLEPLAVSEVATVTTPKGDVVLPAFERDAANARSFIDACQKR